MIFCLNKDKSPLSMVSEAEGNRLLKESKAIVHRQYPFVIRMKDKVDEFQNVKYTLKIDPGSKHTGLALVDDSGAVCWLGVIEHHAEQIVQRLQERSGARRNRRQRETRYRKPKWGNAYKKKDSKFCSDSPRPEGWLPPSVKSIVDNIDAWMNKLSRWCNLQTIIIESVKFDSQLMDNPDISGVEYQQGELMGYEIREYLLEEYQHTCQYCNGLSKDTILEVEHKIPRSKGGSNKISNLTLSCRTCNREKGVKQLDEWQKELSYKRDKLSKTRVTNIEKVLKNKKVGQSSRYSAWVNSSRWALVGCAKRYTEDVQLSNGAVTKRNRIQAGLPKEHYYDALCVKEIPKNLHFKTRDVLYMETFHKQRRMRGQTNTCGVIGGAREKMPNGYSKDSKNLKWKRAPKFNQPAMVKGFKTGDIVFGKNTKGKTFKGGKLYSNTAGCTMTFPGSKKNGTFPQKNAKLIQRGDGFIYTVKKRTL